MSEVKDGTLKKLQEDFDKEKGWCGCNEREYVEFVFQHRISKRLKILNRKLNN